MDCSGRHLAQDVSEGERKKNLNRNWGIFAKSLAAAVCLRPKNFPETKLKSNGLISLERLYFTLQLTVHHVGWWEAEQELEAET